MESMGIPSDWVNFSAMILLFIGIVLASFLFWWLTKKILIVIVHAFAEKSKTKFDDYLVEHKFFSALANLVPLICMEYFLGIVFHAYPLTYEFFVRFINIGIIVIVAVSIFRAITAVQSTLKEKEKYKDKPIESYFQLAKILIGGFFILLLISILFDLTLTYLLTGLGAMTAVLLLIFKDSILGFVGSVQLASNDMIRIGDWIVMEKFGADGNVTEINLTTVKVQNWDKTITTIPTYSLISDAFKNWRGMEESDGRRIARSITIRIESIRFAEKDDLDKWRKINILSDFIEERDQEIQSFNKSTPNVDLEINQRKQTNIGLYRKYLEHYLKQNPLINNEMTLLVRQLAPEENGVPIQLYCFSFIKDWGPHEDVIADIFDHMFATISYFDLEIYEKPSSRDFKQLSK
jgi:miniconductance mechanosensitive channel